jgi:hypothetical protein
MVITGFLAAWFALALVVGLGVAARGIGPYGVVAVRVIGLHGRYRSPKAMCNPRWSKSGSWDRCLEPFARRGLHRKLLGSHSNRIRTLRRYILK